MTFETQHGETVVVGPSTRLVLVTHDMEAGNMAKAVLAKHTAPSLAARGAVYVADISKMPGVISRLMAIPRMRRRPYPVLLDRDATTARVFPVADGKVTAVWLEGGRITRLEQLGSQQAIRAALAATGDAKLDAPTPGPSAGDEAP
jgi:NADPH-dependent ferric siderophore reductase